MSRVFVVRHGESTANRSGIIVSSPENGLREDYGLTPVGQKQASEVCE